MERNTTTINNTLRTNQNKISIFRKIFTKRGMIITFVIMISCFFIYDFVIMSILDDWGATREEVAMPLPGDSLVPGKPIWKMNVATTIDAPPEKIFPYFMQVGQDRAGFYSFDWLERLLGFGIYNTYTIKPEWQDLKAGDFVTFVRAGMGMRVHAVTPNRNITMITNGLDRSHSVPEGKWEMFWSPLFSVEKGEYVSWNWDFNFFPLPDGKTRVVVRCVFSAKGNPISIFLFKQMFAFPSDVMDIEMLRRVKLLAEEKYDLN